MGKINIYIYIFFIIIKFYFFFFFFFFFFLKGIINLQEKNNAKQCVAFDHAGYIFAVGIDSYRIHLYDLKDYQNVISHYILY